MEIICPNCNGKKVVFDASSLGTTVAFPFLWFFELAAGVDDGVTKKPCPVCRGTGRVFLANTIKNQQ
jgi:DnaJ-class molecular chaperone